MCHCVIHWPLLQLSGQFLHIHSKWRQVDLWAAGQSPPCSGWWDSKVHSRMHLLPPPLSTFRVVVGGTIITCTIYQGRSMGSAQFYTGCWEFELWIITKQSSGTFLKGISSSMLLHLCGSLVTFKIHFSTFALPTLPEGNLCVPKI